MTGVPYYHAISYATWVKRDAEDYVYAYFKELYIKSYLGAILLCVGERHGLKNICR